MGGTFTSWAALKNALRKEMQQAMEETVNDAYMDVLEHNQDFYAGSVPQEYVRTGEFGASMKNWGIQGGGDWLSADVGRDGSYQYRTGSYPDGLTVFGWAETGAAGIVGKQNTWQETEEDIESDLQKNFSKHFS